jgi:hypothetical protein
VLRPGGLYLGIEPSLLNPLHLVRLNLGSATPNERPISVRRMRTAFQSPGAPFDVRMLGLAPRFPLLQWLGLPTCVGILARRTS